MPTPKTKTPNSNAGRMFKNSQRKGSIASGKRKTADRQQAGGGEDRVGGPLRNFFRNRVRKHVRTGVASELAKSGQYDWNAARQIADDLTDEEIDAKINEVGLQEGDSRRIGEGGFLDWLKNGGLAQILEIIKAIASIFTMFGRGGAEGQSSEAPSTEVLEHVRPAEAGEHGQSHSSSGETADDEEKAEEKPAPKRRR